MAAWYRRDGKSVMLTLHIQPGAKRSEIAGLHGNALKIRLAAPPVEGRANEALLRFVAGLFQVPLRDVELLHGAQSRHKTVSVAGSIIEPQELLPEIREGLDSSCNGEPDLLLRHTLSSGSNAGTGKNGSK